MIGWCGVVSAAGVAKNWHRFKLILSVPENTATIQSANRGSKKIE